MSRRFRSLFVLVLAVCAAAFWWGCSQPDDIVVGKGQTVIHLSAERLPTPPPGMYYELWVADTVADNSVQGAVSIGKFSYDFENQVYLTQDGAARPDSNRFAFGGDVLNYQWMVVSVQRSDGTDVGLGPVMLIDTITAPFYGDIDMVFPLSDSLWGYVLDFNMESPSNGRDTLTDGCGLWFCAYNQRAIDVRDTTALLQFRIDSIWRDSFASDQGPCINNIVNIINIHPETLQIVAGFDTTSRQVIRFDYVIEQECDTGQDSLLITSISSLTYQRSSNRVLDYDDFQQLALPLPDVTPFGWKYKGWVVSSAIPEAASLGKMTMPAWRGEHNLQQFINPDGGLLSTGTFMSDTLPDDGNPYVGGSTRVPPYPGEDFLADLPNGYGTRVNLVPSNAGPTGTVFIAMEPSNMTTDTTNFPLIFMMRDLPGSRAVVTSLAQQFVMLPVCSAVRGDLKGWPRLRATIERL